MPFSFTPFFDCESLDFKHHRRRSVFSEIGALSYIQIALRTLCESFLPLWELVYDIRGMILTAVLTSDPDGGFVAFNPETGTTTQGDTTTEALANLKEATSLYLEEFPMEETSPALLTTFEVALA